MKTRLALLLLALAAALPAAQAQTGKWPDKPVRVVVPFAPGGSTDIIARVLTARLSQEFGQQFIELARAKPRTLNYGSSGIGGATHLATELFLQMTKTEMVHIPYKGDAPAIADLLGGQVQLIFSSVPALIQHLKSGRVRGLAVTTVQRYPELPDLPAIAETLPGYEHTSWNGMWAPKGTPREIISRLNQSLARILKQPELQERLRADGRQPAHSTPEEFARVIAREITKWKTVVKVGNIKVN